METLSKGLKCKLWDGRTVTVRCHLLFVLEDLPAMAKLCRLRGSGSYRPCRFCLVQGGREEGKTAVYYPSYVIEEEGDRQLWGIGNLPLRSTDQTFDSIVKIEDLAQSGALEDPKQSLKNYGRKLKSTASLFCYRGTSTSNRTRVAPLTSCTFCSSTSLEIQSIPSFRWD